MTVKDGMLFASGVDNRLLRVKRMEQHNKYMNAPPKWLPVGSMTKLHKNDIRVMCHVTAGDKTYLVTGRVRPPS